MGEGPACLFEFHVFRCFFKAHECKMFKGGRFFGWIPLVMNDETREVRINDEMSTKKKPIKC